MVKFQPSKLAMRVRFPLPANLFAIVEHGSAEYRRDRFVAIPAYEVRPRKDKRGVDLISDALPFGGLWYGEPDAISNAVGSVKFTAGPHC